MVTTKRHRNPNNIITIEKTEYEGPEEDEILYRCPRCKKTLILVDDATGEYRCNRDLVPFYPRKNKDIRRMDVVDIPEDPEDKEALVAYTPDANAAFHDSHKVEPQGTFKAMQDKGIHLTYYEERSGDNRLLRSFSDSSGYNSSSSGTRKVSAPAPFRTVRIKEEEEE